MLVKLGTTQSLEVNLDTYTLSNRAIYKGAFSGYSRGENSNFKIFVK